MSLVTVIQRVWMFSGLLQVAVQLTRLREVIAAILALAEELKRGTIESVLAKSDIELALEVLLGKRKLWGLAYVSVPILGSPQICLRCHCWGHSIRASSTSVNAPPSSNSAS
jgi:hypothetical protein